MTRTAARTARILAVGALAGLVTGLETGSARGELVGEAVATVTAGATDNPLLVQDGVAKSADEFTTIRASLRGHDLGARAEQLLSYTYAATFYADTKDANGQVHDLLWTLIATPTARTDLRARVGATYGRLNSINPLNAQNIPMAGFAPVPTGPVTYVGGNASLNGIYRPTGVTTWSELTNVTTFVPVSGDAGKSVVVLQNGHYDRLWGRNALTLDLTGSYLDASPFTFANGAGQLPGNQTLQLQGLVGWRHEFSPAAYVAASAGVLLVDMRQPAALLTAEPVAFGTAHYQTETVLAELIVTQSSQLNVYLGQPLLVDGAVGRLVLPLDRLQRFHVVGLGTAEREWTFGPPLTAAIDLLAADVGLAFAPLTYPFVAAVDYAVQDQIGHRVDMATSYPSLHRQIVMMTLTATWGTNPALR
jgi:hypothetical protein